MTSANFQKSLRKYIVDPLSESITAYVLRQMKESKATVPQEVTNLTTLGLLANPIINFNIEITTSRALVGGDSHFIIKSFVHPTLNDSTYFPRSYTQIENRFRRHVFHPHGALDLSGLCVLTDKEYESHSQTLGFQLAVHSAFGEILAIVGMSLEDEYLREQISKYRNHIRQIFWYVQDESSLDENVKKWVLKNDINVISVDDWKIFWDDIGTVLPKPDEKIC
jgi:hypothetical protein